MANKVNIFVDQGSDYQTTVNVANTNLTGYSAKAQFRKSFSSLKSYDFVTTVSNTSVTLALSSDVSSCAYPGRYLYDCKITSPTGNTTRIVEGILTMNPQVTR